ncbi:MAG: hypothetical protein HYV59_12295 [Planctomycetes bacterium]|nr:hypothetical protein [Planctomycetota bacterium]
METVRQNYDRYAADTEAELDRLGVELNNLLAGPLASKQAWEMDPGKTDVIKKIRKELPDRSETINDSIEQVGNVLVIDTKKPKRLTIIGITILLLMIGGYIALHIYIENPTYKKETGKKLFKAIGILKASILNSDVKLDEIPQDFSDCSILRDKVDTTKAKLGEKPQNSPVQNQSKQNSTDSDNKERDDALTLEFAERISLINGFISAFNKDTGTVTVRSQIVSIIKEEIEKIEKDAVGFSKNDGFFWIAGFWRWLEILFWGEFGVIVGVLVWVCTQAEAGKYTKGMYDREKSWYIAEIVTGPIIVVAVFFLLRQFVGAFMTGIAEEEVRGSIYLTLGISFALGLFIRRTLGIFDYIKEKLPLPKV